MQNPLVKYSINALKILIPLGIFAYLLWQVDSEDYQIFWQQTKRWELLLLAVGTAFTSILLSFFRWYLLVRAFRIPFSVLEAFRLGFIGYLLNFVSFGSVGGDVFKAILVAKDHKEHRPEAVASVLLDRAIGLLGLVILATIGLTIFASDSLSTIMLGIRNSAAVVAVASILALTAAMYLGSFYERIIAIVEKLPVLGEPVGRMARAVRLLRRNPFQVVVLVLLAVVVHALITSAVFLISCGVYQERPTLHEHLQVVPPAMAAGTLPLAPGGMGYQEGALSVLFKELQSLPNGFSGILVATIYRLFTLCIAGVGLIFYLVSPVPIRELDGMAEEAREK